MGGLTTILSIAGSHRPGPFQEAAMYPQLMAMVAAEHVRDMQVQATAARRVRWARRARRISLAGATVPAARLRIATALPGAR